MSKPMTEAQFHELYAKLNLADPEFYNAARKVKLAALVAGKSFEWFQHEVLNTLSRTNKKRDWDWVVRQTQTKKSSETPRQETEEGFQKALKAFGASSVLEAVLKNRTTKIGEQL